MRSRRVVDPTGAEWRVRRVWIGRPKPRFRRVRAGDAGWGLPDWVPSGFGDLGDIEAVVAVVIALVVIVFVIVPLLLFGLELVIVGAALAAGIISRMLLGRPWTVEAERVGGRRDGMSWSVSGWRRSDRALDEIAQALAAGSRPDPHDATERMTRTADSID